MPYPEGGVGGGGLHPGDLYPEGWADPREQNDRQV